MSHLLNPFHTLAVWLVSLLPPGAGELATGSAVMLGILLVFFALLLPGIALAAYLECRILRRSFSKQGDRP